MTLPPVGTVGTLEDLMLGVGDKVEYTKYPDSVASQRIVARIKPTLEMDDGAERKALSDEPYWKLISRFGSRVEWNDYDDDPDEVIKEIVGAYFLHIGKGILYRICQPIFDAERNRWMITYAPSSWSAASSGVFAHLPEDFFREGRFARLKDTTVLKNR